MHLAGICKCSVGEDTCPPAQTLILFSYVHLSIVYLATKSKRLDPASSSIFFFFADLADSRSEVPDIKKGRSSAASFLLCQLASQTFSEIRLRLPLDFVNIDGGVAHRAGWRLLQPHHQRRVDGWKLTAWCGGVVRLHHMLASHDTKG